MSLIDDLKAGLHMAPRSFANPDDNIFPIGVDSIGKTYTPNFLQKIGCISIFSIPIVGG